MTHEVRLDGKDAISLLRLLRGLECLVREESLDERHCVELRGAGSGAAEPDWQERLRGEVSAACGLLEELLDGYEPAEVVSAASGASSPSGLGSTPDTTARTDLP